MPYRYSQIDKRNLEWFKHDDSNGTLLQIRMAGKNIRGFSNLRIDFEYPITAIAGRNGSGKSTVLALAACAFHNHSDGFRLPGRKNPYYTFSDFFIQSSEEVPLEGIAIFYSILYDHWRLTPEKPDGKGVGVQMRKKRYGGRWNNYAKRVHRTVIYLGIDRVVPHAEKSISKSYRKAFKASASRGWEDDVKECVGRILGIDYEEFYYKRHTKYRLALVKARGATYSGFNMGAGEDALFEVISTLMMCPDGSLILIDEIELGLHEEAQAQLIDELKKVCSKRHMQVICTTHSSRILESLPPEGRVFLERISRQVAVIPGISPEYATGKLSGRKSSELLVYVEDDVALRVLQSALLNSQRERVDIIPIGSAVAVIRQVAARFKEDPSVSACVMLDGDKRSTKGQIVRVFLQALESVTDPDQAKSWVLKRIHFLPGEAWPEAWVIDQCSANATDALASDFGVDSERVPDMLAKAKRAGKHREFEEAAKLFNSNVIVVSNSLVKHALENMETEVQEIREFVQKFLI